MSITRQTEILESTMGNFGGMYIADTEEVEGDFSAIQVIEDCTFTTLEGNVEDLDTATLEAGTIVYGKFKTIELATGKVIAYYSKAKRI